jgi:hypothetical protein
VARGIAESASTRIARTRKSRNQRRLAQREDDPNPANIQPNVQKNLSSLPWIRSTQSPIPKITFHAMIHAGKNINRERIAGLKVSLKSKDQSYRSVERLL